MQTRGRGAATHRFGWDFRLRIAHECIEGEKGRITLVVVLVVDSVLNYPKELITNVDY